MKATFRVIPTRVLAVLISIILSVIALLPVSASAYDGQSFSACTNRVTVMQKNIVKNGRVLGYLKLFRCSGHYYSVSNNTAGSAVSTYTWIERARSSNAFAYRAYSEITGKYTSISKLIGNPSGSQCFVAFGSVSTSAYGTGNTTYNWCA